MRRSLPLLLALILCAASGALAAQLAEEPARAVPKIIIPGAPMGLPGQAAALILPAAPQALILPQSGLVMPQAQVIQAPAAAIVPAARALTEAEAAPEKPQSQQELAALVKSLSPDAEGREAPGAADASRAGALDAAFDGALAPEAKHWDDVSGHFTQGPHAPDLAVVASAGRSLIARLLPSLYRRVPATTAFDRGENPSTGHSWTEHKGHLIELAPSRPDSRGEVASAFGVPGRARVQQKLEQLLEYSHEYFHVIFDAVVGRKAEHVPHSAYSAMTEGFAVSGEQLLIERLLYTAPSLGLGPRDTMDLAAVARARGEWLDVEDTHYAEGIQAFRHAYDRGGQAGLLAFAASLSARRMASVPRSDPAYQLALGDSGLLGAYLGRDEQAASRRGLAAFAKAARGEALSEEESRLASAAAEQAGPEGWRRLFDRTLLLDKRLKDPAAGTAPSGDWWEKKAAEPAPSVEAVFALARLSPAAGAALSRYLAQAVSSKDGAARIFGRPGPTGALQAVAAGAEALPWDAESRRAWDAGLTRWLMALN